MLKPLDADPQGLLDFFREAGFTHEDFRSNTHLRDLPSKRLGNLPGLLEYTAAPTASNILLRWFFLGVSQELAALRDVIPMAILDMMAATGMLVREGGSFRPTVMVTPCEGNLFTADVAATLESAQSADMVLWPNPSTRLLQMFTIRRPSGATLDLGAGCGILAILAARHSEQVVATDLNARATEVARFNVWLNRVNNVECLTGDTFQPVEGRRFDLIACNPPFFVTPSTGQMYCENPMDLDGYCRQLVKAAPRYLNEGGFLQITFEWAQVAGETWHARLTEWLEDTGCDAWVLRNYARKAGDYAKERIGGMMPYSADAASQRFDQWMAYYAARGVEEIHGGILAMRKRSGKNWVRIEEVADLDSSLPFGDSILELFANQDRLETDLTPELMMAWKPRVPADVRLDQQSQLAAGQWKPVSTHLRRPGSLPSSLTLDPLVVNFLRGCDGTRTLGELSNGLAAQVKVDPEVVRQQCCVVMRKLVERRLALL